MIINYILTVTLSHVYKLLLIMNYIIILLICHFNCIRNTYNVNQMYKITFICQNYIVNIQNSITCNMIQYVISNAKNIKP